METKENKPAPTRRPPRTIWWVVAVLVAIVATTLGWLRYSMFEQLDQSCANCRSFIHGYFESYAETNDGWYPRGGATPLDSLAKVVKYKQDVHHFTSHTRSAKLVRYWEQTGTFTPELTCYRYNEGVSSDDRHGLVILYFHKPTLWTCRETRHKQVNLGRPVLLSSERSFVFLTEDDFQKRQATTLRYLEEKGRLKKPTPAK